MMRVYVNLAQFEGLPGSPWQFFNGAAQDNTVNCSTEVKILFLNLAFERWRVSRYRLIERKNCWGFTTQLHQYGVHGNPVQPSGKGGTATKRVEVTKHLDESLLRQVFCFSHIFRHPQTHRIYKLIMQLAECGEALLGAARSTLNESVPSESSCWFSALSGITSAGGGTFIGVADVIQVATVISGVITRVLFGLSDSNHDRFLTSRKTRYLLKILMTGQFCTLA